MEPFVLPIHFGNFQGEHEISAESLTVFIESYKEIATVFGLQIDVHVGVPEEGGWKTKFAIYSGVVLGTLNFIGIDNLSILLTGNESKVYFQAGHKAGHDRLKMIGKFITTLANSFPSDFPKECIKEKNKIYHQFLQDRCIDSFRLGDELAILKSNFPNYIRDLPDEENEYLGETLINVHSPAWKGGRSWKGSIEIIPENESTFSFDRALTGKFWEMVKLDKLVLHTTTDSMQVQLIRRPNQRTKYQVIRVLSYNNDLIDSPLSVDEVHKIASISLEPMPPNQCPQTDLFE